MENCTISCQVLRVLTLVVSMSKRFTDCLCNDDDYKVTKHYFENVLHYNPSLVYREYLPNEHTKLVEAVIDCSFRYARISQFYLVSIFELEYSQRIFACCDSIKPKISPLPEPDWPDKFAAQFANFQNEKRNEHCQMISERLKSCITADFRQVSEQHIERKYFI
ncbi:hypothetical protein RF11_11624 [Thelohanellus kitauei]|uniref:Uncharacterized protein n=1 Tax=Thelohanellus kitauei TaxID=669202 RepID=A0A0C2J8L4_THEKT|nr:hypothetical protein RF11_11624 [Thelohanellus kitauei]